MVAHKRLSEHETGSIAPTSNVNFKGATCLYACDQCRARKVKCDRTGPCCGACSRIRLNCSFRSNPEVPEVPDAYEDDGIVDTAVPLTEAGIKRRRTLQACEKCRRDKLKCSGTVPCERCRNRNIECRWSTEPRIRRGNVLRDLENRSAISITEMAGGPPLPGFNAQVVDRDTTRQHIEAYFDKMNPMTCIFLHRPSVMADWTRDRLDPVLVMLLCALGRRLGDASPPTVEITRSWAREAQVFLLGQIGTHNLAQLQALTLTVQFHFLAGDMSEAWNLISLAARLAFTLRLNYEHPELDPIAQESQRRVVWAIYQTDRVLSGGVEDLAVCPVNRMHIRLPCDDHRFHRGIQSQAGFLDEKGPSQGISYMDILAFHVKLNAIRDRILRYAALNDLPAV
jgi:hypothetical protein